VSRTRSVSRYLLAMAIPEFPPRTACGMTNLVITLFAVCERSLTAEARRNVPHLLYDCLEVELDVNVGRVLGA